MFHKYLSCKTIVEIHLYNWIDAFQLLDFQSIQLKLNNFSILIDT